MRTETPLRTVPTPLRTVPTPLRTIDAVMEDGAIVRLRQHGNPAGPRLALSHGNGLAIDGYLPFWGPLRDRYELIVFDFRNHGQNPLHAFENHNWPNFVSDLERIFRLIQAEFGEKRTAGIFHSLSATTASMHSQRMGVRWDPLVLFDPPFHPPDGHTVQASQNGDKENLAIRAARRTVSYAEPAELAAKMAASYQRWTAEAPALMARATLRPEPATGQWMLACPREYESHVFNSNHDGSTWRGMARMPVAVKLICGDPEGEDAMVPSLLCRALAAETPALAYEVIPATTHFLQIERPVECIRAMETFLAQCGIRA